VDHSSVGPLPQEWRQQAVEAFDHDLTESYHAPVRTPAPANPEPKRYAELLANAGLLLRNQEYHLAQNLLRRVLHGDPNNAVALRGMAESSIGVGDMDLSLKCYEALIQRHPSSENIVALADLLYELEEYDEALRFYQLGLDNLKQDTPVLFDVFKNVGNILVRKGDFEGAEENYNKAYTINPDSDALLVNYGTLEIQRNNLDKALARFRAAVEVNSQNSRAWVGLALIHREYGDIELSWGNLEKALDLDPNNSTALRMLIEAAFKSGRIDSAIERIQSYLIENDQDTEMAFWLAKLLTFGERYSAALLEMTRVLEIDPHIEGGQAFFEAIEGALRQQQQVKAGE